MSPSPKAVSLRPSHFLQHMLPPPPPPDNLPKHPGCCHCTYRIRSHVMALKSSSHCQSFIQDDGYFSCTFTNLYMGKLQRKEIRFTGLQRIFQQACYYFESGDEARIKNSFGIYIVMIIKPSKEKCLVKHPVFYF